jgi:L-aminopeptidase/D-esterase-like protein
MTKKGATNTVTDVAGLLVGHYTSMEAACGVTVILCPEGATAGVDVRGSAPATRETDLLDPVNLVEKIQAVTLSGGSAYGLSASDGVVRWLAGKGLGFPLPGGQVVPIAPAACLYDLGRGKDFIPPIGPDWGAMACEQASGGPVELGCVGAGTGAVAGPIKGGLGSASEILDCGITVAALVAVNSLGSVIDSRTGRPWEIGAEVDGEFGALGGRSVTVPEQSSNPSPCNTTIGVVATDAILTKAQAEKIAQMAQDGLARAIRPAHTMFDGDTIFCLATGRRPLPTSEGFFASPTAPAVNELGAAAADCMSRAIVRAIIEARSLGELRAFRDLPDR